MSQMNMIEAIRSALDIIGNDAITDLSCGIANRVVDLFGAVLVLAIYGFVWSELRELLQVLLALGSYRLVEQIYSNNSMG